MDELIKVVYKAANSLSDAQATSILKQLYGEGFKWGLSTDVDIISPEEPCSLAQALKSPDAPKWLAACNEELNSIKSLGVFQVVPHNAATGHTIMDRKFVFKLEQDQHGLPVWWEAQFIVKGYSAIYEIDYNETMSPTM